MRILRPTVQPEVCSACSNAARRAADSGSSPARAPTTPMRLIRSGCCARAAIGHAAAAPPSRVMNARLLTRSPRPQGAGTPLDRKSHRLSSLEVDDQLVAGRQLKRQVARLCTPNNSVYQSGRLAVELREIGAIGH